MEVTDSGKYYGLLLYGKNYFCKKLYGTSPKKDFRNVYFRVEVADSGKQSSNSNLTISFNFFYKKFYFVNYFRIYIWKF